MQMNRALALAALSLLSSCVPTSTLRTSSAPPEDLYKITIQSPSIVATPGNPAIVTDDVAIFRVEIDPDHSASEALLKGTCFMPSDRLVVEDRVVQQGTCSLFVPQDQAPRLIAIKLNDEAIYCGDIELSVNARKIRTKRVDQFRDQGLCIYSLEDEQFSASRK